MVIVILLLTFSHAQATDVGISVRIGQPGFYGEIHLGDFYPVPDLIYPDPVIIQRPSVYVRQQPIYLHVPPGHAKLWHRYCYQYNACSQPVYFIRENWYNNVYVPHYHQHGSQQHRRIESLQYRHYDSDRHYQDRHYDTHRYDDDHDYREKRRYKSNDHRYGNDKHERYNRHDKHGKHDKNDRGRGKKHD
ncbi:MAG: hypothetical protein KDF49_07215 [Nitrosomonas sp.]|nr:hypothetical protein [Nitrosomonas sp.]